METGKKHFPFGTKQTMKNILHLKENHSQKWLNNILLPLDSKYFILLLLYF